MGMISSWLWWVEMIRFQSLQGRNLAQGVPKYAHPLVAREDLETLVLTRNGAKEDEYNVREKKYEGKNNSRKVGGGEEKISHSLSEHMLRMFQASRLLFLLANMGIFPQVKNPLI